MKYTISYSSKTGNTRALAEHLKKTLPEDGLLFFGETEGLPARAFGEADVMFAGFWTEKGSCDRTTAAFLKKADGKMIALFGTAGFGGSATYFDRIAASISEIVPKSCFHAKPFICEGRIAPDVFARYKSELDKDPGDERMLRLVENFERVKTHPDDADMKVLASWARSIIRA